jgi:small neutral amino acid transporter SnatA (MarC family)
VPFYLRPGWIVTAVLCVGPLAIPLFWMHRNWSRRKKIIWTVTVLLVSWGVWVLMQQSIKSIEDYYEILNQLMK